MKRDWTLTPYAFEKLLAFLDSDREIAGRRYEKIRQKLIKLFQWRGIAAPEDFADRTIDRVARRLAEGQQLRADNPYLYFHGVAMNVLREASREPRLEALEEVRAPEAEGSREREHACLDECLAGLLPESRRLVLEYHAQQGRAKIETRNVLFLPR